MDDETDNNNDSFQYKSSLPNPIFVMYLLFIIIYGVILLNSSLSS